MKNPLLLMFGIMLIGILAAGLWDALPAIKTGVHALLDPTAGALMTWHTTFGFVIFVAIMTLITTLVQKYGTDQNALKTLREEQQLIQAQLKEHRADPAKQMELSKKSMELVMESMPLTMRPVLYTSLPFILFFRWFNDYFVAHPVKIFGLGWIWAYLILAIIFSSIYRKILKVY
jgi:uncharacterized membrane protein (DUF106 family)